jgi:hypothetical protein
VTTPRQRPAGPPGDTPGQDPNLIIMLVGLAAGYTPEQLWRILAVLGVIYVVQRVRRGRR